MAIQYQMNSVVASNSNLDLKFYGDGTSTTITVPLGELPIRRQELSSDLGIHCSVRDPEAQAGALGNRDGQTHRGTGQMWARQVTPWSSHGSSARVDEPSQGGK